MDDTQAVAVLTIDSLAIPQIAGQNGYRTSEALAPPKIRAARDGLPVSEEDYWLHYYEGPESNYEWSNGYLEEKPVSEQVTVDSYQWLNQRLHDYLEVHDVAQITGLEMGFRMVIGGGRVSVRKPDLAIVRHDNPVPLYKNNKRYAGIFDLCIEAISDSNKENRERDTVVKKAEYEAAKVEEYYIIDGNRKRSAFYSRNQYGYYEPIKAVGGIIRSKVLPGFRFRIKDLYRLPPTIKLVEDDVYKDYVIPEYQQEKKERQKAQKRAEQQRLRAEQERLQKEEAQKRAQQERLQKEEAQKRAEQERLEKERLMALLEKMGIAY
ncbi:MAG: Uma2 family endonuclease [Ardenticatenaceae bacterium]